MAPRANITDDQNIVFLLSCLRNSQGPSQINFTKVAEECNIISVGAASKRLSRLSIKYQHGVPSDDATANNGEEGGPNEIDESPSKKTPNKANRSGKGIVKSGKDEKTTITAPRAAGVGKKRSPAKPKATATGLAGGTTTSTFTTVATVDGVELKMGNVGDDEGETAEFVPSFFDEQMDRGVGAEHGNDTE
ncbi:hypothetical protein TCE0_044r17489 [Talaromyces pinophilus]|uniref:Myb-like DNA-binding domain-containing protein n=1 Tax=Talaromyces pinophilus TaxID=128442 RepID=A0A478EDB6_TALPI|nr:hypothetical protein TCE0_044r17489 [Talaromyces pinophilus]